MSESDQEKSKKGWEELLFGAIEKIAATPGKLKDPQSAMDWFKGLREDLQEKIKDELGQRIAKMDFNQLATRLGDHLAENYRLKISASVEWEPKTKRSRHSPTSKEATESTES